MPLTIETANNPLSLTAGTRIGPFVSGPPITSPTTGYTFDTFPTPQYGFQAGVQYLINKFGGQSIGQAIGSAFNGDQAAVQAQGLNLGDTLTAANAPQVAAGIVTNEGALGYFGGLQNLMSGSGAGTPNSGSVGVSAQGSTTTAMSFWSELVSAFVNPGGAAGNVLGQAAGASAGAGAAQVSAGLGRGALIVLGLALIIVALIVLASQNKQVQEIVKTASTAAIAA